MSTAIQFRNKLSLPDRGPELQNRIVAVVGRKGSGKSTLTRELLTHCRRLFLFDTMGEHNWIPDQFTDLAQSWDYIFAAGSGPADFMGSFIPGEDADDQLEKDFQEICSATYEAGNLTLAVEELPMLSQPGYVPSKYNRLIRLGRHRCVNLLYTGQRLSECPRRVTAATDVFVLFSHTEPRDVDAIAERCGPEVADLVQKLDEHEFLVYVVAARSVVLIDPQWYDAVLNTDIAWTPAIGGKSGKKALWSLSE